MSQYIYSYLRKPIISPKRMGLAVHSTDQTHPQTGESLVSRHKHLGGLITSGHF